MINAGRLLAIVIGGLLLAGCNQGASSGSDAPATVTPLAYTGKTDAAAIDALDETQQESLVLAATRGAAIVIEYMQENRREDRGLLTAVIANTGVADLAIPANEQVWQSPNPCSEPQGTISYRARDDRYLTVDFDQACVPRFTAADMDVINSLGSGPTGAIGLAVLGIPSNATEMSLTVSGSLLVDTRYHTFYTDDLTILDDTWLNSVMASAGSYQPDSTNVLSAWLGGGLSKLFPCEGGVCKVKLDALNENVNGDYSSFVGASCIANCISSSPIYGPVESIGNDVYVPDFGKISIVADQLLTCAADGNQDSPFQSGSLTLTGASGSLTVTYNGCGQPFTVTTFN